MALDNVGPNFSYLEGGVVITPPEQHTILDAFIIEQIKKQEEEKRRDTRQRIGVTVPGLYDMPPMPSRRPVSDDRMTDDGDSDRGYCEIDM